MTIAATRAGSGTGHEAALRRIEDRLLWLATAIVHHTNRSGRTRPA